MCGRYYLTYEELLELESFLEIVDKGNYRPPGEQGELDLANYNVTPTHKMPVAYLNEDGNRTLETMGWGYLGWKPKPNQKEFRPVNTRDDSIGNKPMWTRSFKKRCIVPMKGFYEWKGTKGNKTPFLIKPKEGKFLAAAGVYNTVTPEGEEDLKTYSIITTSPNKLMEDIHDRMPAFLHPEEFGHWLNPEHTTEYLKDMLKPYPDDALEAFIVSKEVGNVRNNHSALIEPASLF